MTGKRSSEEVAKDKLTRKTAAKPSPKEERMMASGPTIPSAKAVIVKDLLGSFSEQTGASFG